MDFERVWGVYLGMSQEKEGLTMPESLLSRINEHTTGGFVLFYMGADGGAEFTIRADNIIVKRGLVSYARDLLESMRESERYEHLGDFDPTEDSDEDE